MVKNAKELLETLQKNSYSRLKITPEEYSKQLLDIPNDVIDKIVESLGGFSSEEVKKNMKKQLLEEIKLLKNLELPTQYQTHGDYFLMNYFANRIEKSIDSIRLKGTNKEWRLRDLSLNFTRPIFGTLPTGDIQAVTYGLKGSNEYLIVFESDLFHFCNLLSKIIARALPFDRITDGERTEFSTDIDKIRKNIEYNNEILQRFQELIIAYLIKGKVVRAPQYYLKAPYTMIAENLRDSMELFVMGHEYAHILLNHLKGKESFAQVLDFESAYNIIFKWEEEFEADSLGLLLMIGAMKNIGYDNSLSYWGAECFCSGYEVIEKGKSILRTGTDEFYWRKGKKDGPVGDHPPAETRRTKLREMMKIHFDEKPINLSKIVEEIIKILWEKTRPILIEYHNKNVNLDPRWHNK